MPVEIKEYRFGEMVWIAIRSRSEEWSWIQPDEAAELGKKLIEASIDKDVRSDVRAAE